MTLAPDSERLLTACLPLLRAALGGVEVRRRGGVAGLYLRDVLFGVIQDGRLLFRVDARTRRAYDAAEADADADADETAGAFDPPGGGSMAAATFRRVPPFVLDDEDTLADWGRAAWEAAKRARESAFVA